MLRCSMIVCMLALIPRCCTGGEVNFGGVELGATLDEITAIARKKHVELVGPGKTILDAERKIMATAYRCAKPMDRRLGIVSQRLFILDDLLVGVSLTFGKQADFDDFLDDLRKAGYKLEGNSGVGQLKGGKHDGAQVELTISAKKAKKAKDSEYAVQVRCLGIVANKAGGATDAENGSQRAVDRAL